MLAGLGRRRPPHGEPVMATSPAEIQAFIDSMKAARPPEATIRSQERLYEQMQSLVRGDEWATFRSHVEGLRAEADAIRDGLVLELATGTHPNEAGVTALRIQWAVVHTLNTVLDLPGALATKAQAIAKTLDNSPPISA